MPTVNSYTKYGVDQLLVPIKYIQYAIKTADYTLVAADQNSRIGMNLAVANELTVPPMADAAIPVGSTIIVVQLGIGLTTITPGVSVTFRSLNDYVISAGQYARIRLEKLAANEWFLSGDLADA